MPRANTNFLGFSLQPQISSAGLLRSALARQPKRTSKSELLIRVLGASRPPQQLRDELSSTWQNGLFQAWVKKNESGESDHFAILATQRPTVLVRFSAAAMDSRDPLVKSHFARARDCAGQCLQLAKTHSLNSVRVVFDEATEEQMFGFLVGLEIASYQFLNVSPLQSGSLKAKKESSAKSFDFNFEVVEGLHDHAPDLKLLRKVVLEAGRLGVAVNLSRHLVNLPASELNPRTYAQAVQGLFSGLADVKVEVWDPKRLARERMHLLLAVGGAATEGPRLVRIQYRPKKKGAEKKPVAVVGKGITFDSGGLDIKPSSAMRLMKKDMGGSASALAVAWWAAASGLPLAVDTYLALAENAVSAASFRPGDILRSRSGQTVEIHNTDAEGRLVLADALELASESSPACIIDLATLTGAIKVGLGAEIAGLFATHSDLALKIFDAGLKRGDLVWRMPLYSGYKGALRSHVADLVNATDGFGGAITAALFLEKFTGGRPWAHLDIYAWRDSAAGAWLEPGGSGQGVLNLTEVLNRFVSQPWAEE